MSEPRRHGPQDIVPSVVGPISQLVPHPRNYKEHPEEQVEHLMASMEQFGQVRNIVVANDGATILAGHGVVEAAFRLGWDRVEWKQLDLAWDSPEAIKLVVLDNEVGRFAITDTDAMAQMLREVQAGALDGLHGTGYDDQLLATLASVAQPVPPVYEDANPATPEPPVHKVVIQFTNERDRLQFIDQLNLNAHIAFTKVTPHAMTGWWPKPDDA